jgi:DNA polymerase-4
LRLQRRILDEVGVTVSVGLSFNKFLAKTASDLDKPDGFSVIGRGDAPDFLKSLKVSDVFGVGPVFAKKLNADGLYTLADVLKRDERAADEGPWRRRAASGPHCARRRHPRKSRPNASANRCPLKQPSTMTSSTRRS